MSHPRFQDDIIYQIYPRSFKDSDGDGIGDIPGIIAKLPYLKKLGITAIWLSPVFASPMEDMGYDIADYYHIDPLFGSDEDMDELIEKAKKNGIRIIMDMVLNHTSKEHEWFKQAAKDKNSPYRDFYIWRKTPNDIGATFGGSAWEYNQATDDYYFHLYAPGQPDLNWDYLPMREALYQACDYWLEKGVYGFRLDVIENIGKEVDRHIIQNGPHLHERLHELNRRTFGKYDGIAIGECWCADHDTRLLYTDPAREELSMVFLFNDWCAFHDREFGKWKCRPFNPKEYRDIIYQRQYSDPAKAWDTLFWNNHDLPRALNRYADLRYRDQAAKMMFASTLFLRGTPFIYQGDELGMVNGRFASVKDFRDIEALNHYQILQDKGMSEAEAKLSLDQTARDNARIPMRWNERKGYGFTSGKPWVDGGKDPGHSVAEEEKDPDSVLHFYRSAIALWKDERFRDLIRDGGFAPDYLEREEWIAYSRILGGKKLRVIANFSNHVYPLPIIDGPVLLHNYQDESPDFRPYEIYVFLNE